MHQPALYLNRELRPRTLTDAIYADQMMRRGLMHLRYVQSPGDLGLAAEIEGLGPVLCADRTNARREWVIEVGDAVALIALGRESVDANVAAPNDAALERTVDLITAALRPPVDDGGRVWVGADLRCS